MAMRKELIEEILIPRLSHNPILMLEIIAEVTNKILGKRSVEDSSLHPVTLELKRVCFEAIL
jgi:hypothetical protein